MRRILLVVTVALVMAAVMAASALPALAEGQGPSEETCIKIAVRAITIGLLFPAVDKACGDQL